MKPLKIDISGIRGVGGETFTPELAVGFAQAFGTWVAPAGRPPRPSSGQVKSAPTTATDRSAATAPRILVCRDTRPSGPMVHAAVVSGLLASGCEVIDLAVAPTPTLQLAVTWLDADGGISVTAGHNPAPWNALKLVRSDGLYLNEARAEEVLDRLRSPHQSGWRRI